MLYRRCHHAAMLPLWLAVNFAPNFASAQGKATLHVLGGPCMLLPHWNVLSPAATANTSLAKPGQHLQFPTIFDQGPVASPVQGLAGDAKNYSGGVAGHIIAHAPQPSHP